ncbi:GlxA family transcriptional regulator [Nocardia altamirensis]|uniref:GlxA family transcriptional regulator n=1 Tax=Nocardia altamirensis TaxID=472158 RepID=UPI000AD4C6AE|nr:helix-turn-helix domain-containing protein [Nocardia altamirensis]
MVLPNVVAFDLSVPAQVFGHPDERDRYALTVCAQTPGVVPTTTGFAVSVDAGLEALDTAETVVIPGYAPHSAPSAEVIEALRQSAARGARMISVCTGAFALAAAGLLDGKRATTHWRDAAELAARYPAVHVDADALYVCEESVLTSAGIAAGIDLCVHVVRGDYGEHAAAEVARRMVVAPHRTGGQAQFLHRPVPATGTGLSATCEWALTRLADRITVAELARHAGWAPRTFARRFVAETGTSPQRWLTAQRLLEARRLLEVTDLPIDQVADHTGLGTAANLRLLLARDTGTTPSHYRRAYRGVSAAGPRSAS